ncbi:MAG: Macrolide export ATP-binding/permease protein MacB [Phycisphaerae bacterium]|nr:Macrolide export ATP-binding/permease protein MacB [Phycisphaerae bacterium]
MLIWTTIKIALASLTTNKLRSFLTMLGVVIGVGAVIAMLSLGSAFGDVISGFIGKLGTNVLFIRPGQKGIGAVTMVQTLTPEDGEAILSIRGVKAVSPWALGSGQVEAGNKNTNSAIITGASPPFLSIQNYEVSYGRMFDDSEVRRQARVAVLGPKVADDLFGRRDPVGEDLKINGLLFHVIGQFKAKGEMGRFNPDDQIIIPYTTAMHQLPPRRDYVQSLVIETFNRNQLDQATEDIRALLRKRHRLQSDQDDDFDIQNMAQLLETFHAVNLGLTMFLGTVAAISLVVGGIGIMNIMLATVAERTREIGIRKAIGAKDRDILRQFLVEALVLTLGGGIIGLVLGWLLMVGVAAGVQKWLAISPSLQWWVVGMSIAISTLVGLASGLYPALRASRLNPVQALRYE